MTSTLRTLCAWALCLALPLCAAAQSGAGSGALDGVVIDGDAKAVPGVAVEIREANTGYVRSRCDRRTRAFRRPGHAGRHATMSKPSSRDLRPPVARASWSRSATRKRVSLLLNVAGVTEAVTVQAQASVDTTGAAVASNIDLRAIADLPVRGRNFTEFVQLTPAVVQESDRFGLVIGGQRSINSNIAIDGADFNDPLQGNQRGGNESAFFFPQSAVREFQVVRSGAGAETGRTSAGFVNVVTKSGTNALHGEALYFNRNKQLTSANAFGRKLNNQQNQFGGAAGGPLARDKAFYFASFEQNFLRVPFVVKFQEQAAGVVVPAELTALEGEQFGTNNPTSVFTRSDLRLSERNHIDLQYTYSRLTGKNFNFDSPQVDVAATANFTRRTESHAVKAGLQTVAVGDRSSTKRACSTPPTTARRIPTRRCRRSSSPDSALSAAMPDGRASSRRIACSSPTRSPP